MNYEAITRAIMGVISQGKPSYDGTTCRYRGPDGTKCAIGHLIADEHYGPHLEMLPADRTAVTTALLKSGIDASDTEFAYLVRLQLAHDLAAKRGGNDKQFLALFRMELRELVTGPCTNAAMTYAIEKGLE